MASARFVHLRVHTAYSLSEGAIRVEELAKRCAELKMPAVAMTDTNTLAGAEVFTKTLAAAGVQPIIGAQLTLQHLGNEGPQSSQIALLAKDAAGYANLIALISAGQLLTRDGTDPKIDIKLLQERSTGLILLTGGPRGPIDAALAAGADARAEARLKKLHEIFGDRLYVELQRCVTGYDPDVEAKLLKLADAQGLPLVATNEAFFLTPDMHEAHQALLCIADGDYLLNPKRRQVSEHNHLKTAEEMAELFRDLPDAVENTLQIAKRCSVGFKKSKPALPAFPGVEAGRTEEQEVEIRAKDGLEARLDKLGLPEEKRASYRDRLAYEIGVIVKMGFAGYFLIVSDFIGWAKDNGIGVGPGRGSGAGSVVAWSLKITDLDPLRYGLLFERFLNPDRVSMPDFDVDFCQERRDEVIDYVRKRYGEHKVAQIGTTGTLKARAVVRDVGRVLQVPYPVVDRWSKLIPNNPAQPVTLRQAMDSEPLKSELLRAEPVVLKMFDIGLKLEGLYRHVSKHAAGVVIARDGNIHETVPVFRDKDGTVVTQFDMKAVENAGLVKFDFLGLKTIDVIDGAVRLIAKDGVEIDFDKIGVEDKPTYEMLADADGFGVFQLESSGMRQAMRQIRPSDIEDIIALVSLYRPGPMENIPTYAQVKHGERSASYLHPLMEPVVKPTNGVIIYQEQVMEIAKCVAGYSLGQADLLRRAMGKKVQKEMDAQRDTFTKGAALGHVDLELEDGRTLRVHAATKFRVQEVPEQVTAQEALEKGYTLLV